MNVTQSNTRKKVPSPGYCTVSNLSRIIRPIRIFRLLFGWVDNNIGIYDMYNIRQSRQTSDVDILEVRTARGCGKMCPNYKWHPWRFHKTEQHLHLQNSYTEYIMFSVLCFSAHIQLKRTMPGIIFARVNRLLISLVFGPQLLTDGIISNGYSIKKESVHWCEYSLIIILHCSL